MLRTMTGWSFGHQSKAFVPKKNPQNIVPERVDALLDAVIDLGPDPVVLRVCGLLLREAARVCGYLGQGSALFGVNHRMSELTNGWTVSADLGKSFSELFTRGIYRICDLESGVQRPGHQRGGGVLEQCRKWWGYRCWYLRPSTARPGARVPHIRTRFSDERHRP